MRLGKCVFLLVLLVLVMDVSFAQSGAAGGQKLLTPADVVGIREIDDVQIAPDGRAVAFVVMTPAGLKNQPRAKDTDIWIVPTGTGGKARPFALSPHPEESPRWSPDGCRLAFLSGRDGRSAGLQIFLLPADGGEAEQLTYLEMGVTTFKWSPDGTMIAFTSRSPADKNEDTGDARVVDKASGGYNELWTLDLASSKTVPVLGKELRFVDFCWSPDGKELALISDGALVVASRLSGKALRTLSGNVGSRLMRRQILDWSPDGRRLLFGQVGDLNATWMAIVPAEGGPVRPLLKEHRSTPLKAVWDVDSKHVVVESFEGMSGTIRRVDAETGEATTLVDRLFLPNLARPDFSLAADGETVAFLSSAVTEPAGVWVSIGGSARRALTRLEPHFASFQFGEEREVRWKNPEDGWLVPGTLVLPVGYIPGKRYPTVVHIHGGPYCAWSTGWYGSWHDWAQLLAARGYAVLLPNPRGSLGQGVAFADALRGNFGLGAFKDVMAGVDQLIKEGIADPERLAIGGHSYGGYLTAFAITQTKRFKAAVVSAGINNVESFAGSSPSMGQGWAESYLLGMPQKRPDMFKKHSPLQSLAKSITPTLVLHGERDSKIPLEQGYELYYGLKGMGVDTRMVIYPREGHVIQEPAHQLDYLEQVLAWYDKYLKK